MLTEIRLRCVTTLANLELWRGGTKPPNWLAVNALDGRGDSPCLESCGFFIPGIRSIIVYNQRRDSHFIVDQDGCATPAHQCAVKVGAPVGEPSFEVPFDHLFVSREPLTHAQIICGTLAREAGRCIHARDDDGWWMPWGDDVVSDRRIEHLEIRDPLVPTTLEDGWIRVLDTDVEMSDPSDACGLIYRGWIDALVRLWCRPAPAPFDVLWAWSRKHDALHS